jgi:hypothetical protein
MDSTDKSCGGTEFRTHDIADLDPKSGTLPIAPPTHSTGVYPFITQVYVYTLNYMILTLGYCGVGLGSSPKLPGVRGWGSITLIEIDGGGSFLIGADGIVGTYLAVVEATPVG